MTEKDFKKIEHNPLLLKENELMQSKYSFFTTRDTFYTPIEDADNKTLSDLLKFIVLFVSKQSPFWNEGDMDMRTEGCCKWANIKKSSEAYKYISSNHEWYYAILMEYFKHINDPIYEQWLSERIGLKQLYDFMRQPIQMEKLEQAVKTKVDLMLKLDELRTSHEKTEKVLFPNAHKIKEIIEKEEAKKDNKLGFAEIYAKRNKKEAEEYD